MRLPLLRTATARFVAVHAALVAAGLVAVFAYVSSVTLLAVESETEEVLATEFRTLADAWATGGLPGLAATLGRRLGPAGERDAVYLLTDAAGQRIVGNLAAAPPTVSPGGATVVLDLFRSDRTEPTRIAVRSVALPDGTRLLVGRDVQAREGIAASLRAALLSALAVFLGLTLLASLALSRLVGRRMAGIAETAAAIVGGALDRRVPVTGRDDEFDRTGAALNAMLDRVGALLGELRMVTDSLAHDLRSPLARLAAHLEAAADPAAPEGARLSRIRAAQEEAEALTRTFGALLDIARAEAGLQAEQFETVDLGALVADIADLYAAPAEEAGLALRPRTTPGLAVPGHRQLLSQALANLVENALRFAPPGSAIDLVAAGAPEGPRVEVADAGPGIPEADRVRVLGRFVRLDESRSGPGAGLGLALVAAVARLHGARLDLLDNAPGLRVRLQFPHAPEGGAPPAGPR